MVMLTGARLAVCFLASMAVMAVSGCGGGGDSDSGGGGSSPSPTGSTSAFNQARGFDDAVTGIVPVNDGSGDVFVAGYFTTYTDVPSHRLIRLHADGTVAQAFPEGFNDIVLYLLAARDNSGAMYALGRFSQFNGQPAHGLIRLTREGTRDTSFQLAAMDQSPNIIALIPGSGDLYIGGGFTTYGGTAIRHLAKLHANGLLDRSFDPGPGFVGLFDGGPGPRMRMVVARMAVEETGSRRLYVSGIFGNYRGTSVPGFVRILPSGEIDLTFISTDVGVTASTLIIEALLPTADGKVYVGGRLRLMRLNENGSLDPSFVPPPLVTLMIAPAGGTSGDIYVSGFQSSNSVFTYPFRRLRPDGSPAPTFQEPPLNSHAYTVVPVGDGSTDVYAGGYFTAFAGNGVNHFARIRSDGTLTSHTVRGSGFDYDVTDIEPGGQGSLYVVTRSRSYNGTAIRPLVRLLANGQLDPSFLFKQEVVEGTGVFINSVRRARNENRLYVTGMLREYEGNPVTSLMRVFSDGSLDPSFVTGRGFRHVIPAASLDDIATPQVVPAVSPAGTLYAFGRFTEYDGTAIPDLVRLTSTGRLDPTFAIGSGFEGSFGRTSPSRVIPNEDGSVYVSGFFDTFNGEPVRNIVRLDSTGRRDPNFMPPQAVQAFAATPDRSLFVNAPGTALRAILRKLKPDGSVDPSFISDPLPGAVITQVITLPNNEVAVIGVLDQQPLSGLFRQRGYVIRLNAEGRQDSNFGLRTTNAPPSVLVEADDGTGDLYLGGAFTRYEQQTMQRIARLSPNGAAK
jgi:uncharacterized delta-60 repeat protein